MKATGIVRKVDDLGRVTLPVETRKVLKIDHQDALEIYTNDDNEIVLKKYQRGCSFCERIPVTHDLKMFKGKLICDDCIKDISKI